MTTPYIKSPPASAGDQRIFDKVQVLRTSAMMRDRADSDIYSVRNGDIDKVFPGMFSDDFPKPIISNFIDIAARDVAETLAPLPSFNASATNMVSDAARSRADKKTKGIQYYLTHSRLATQMYTGADYYASYGRMPIYIEPDFDTKCPRWLILDPRNSYPEIDRWGKVRAWVKIFRQKIAELCAQFPEYSTRITGPNEQPWSQMEIEVCFYHDDKVIMMFLPERDNFVVSRAVNDFGECPVVMARRPGVVQGRGQYDDVMWTQVARNRFANMAMAAAERSVEAPIAAPYDVQEIALGAMALLRSQYPEKIHTVDLGLPQAAFAESQLLDQELKVGARYPQTRTGNLDSSIITGQGVRALEGGFDSQIRAAQDVLVETFREATRMSLRMDEHYWPDDERSIRGNIDGVPYEISWKPSRDIAGDYSCDVSFGFSVGLDANRSLVFILQMLGARLISKDLARRQFPFAVNVTQEEQRIAVEDMRDALTQSLAGYAQTIPLLAQQGMDPSEAVNRIAEIVKGIQKGKPLEDVVSKAFAPEPPPPEMMIPGSEPVPPGAPGGSPFGGGSQVAPGQAQMGPGGRPDLMTLLAGLGSGGKPTTNVNVKRALPAY